MDNLNERIRTFSTLSIDKKRNISPLIAAKKGFYMVRGNESICCYNCKQIILLSFFTSLVQSVDYVKNHTPERCLRLSRLTPEERNVAATVELTTVSTNNVPCDTPSRVDQPSVVITADHSQNSNTTNASGTAAAATGLAATYNRNADWTPINDETYSCIGRSSDDDGNYSSSDVDNTGCYSENDKAAKCSTELIDLAEKIGFERNRITDSLYDLDNGATITSLTELTRHTIYTELVSEEYLPVDKQTLDLYKPKNTSPVLYAEDSDQSKTRKKRTLTPKAKARRHRIEMFKKQWKPKNHVTNQQQQDDNLVSPEMKLLEEELEDLEDANLCKLCVDNPLEVVFLPCGHFSTCFECSIKMINCPVCRVQIVKTVLVNTSNQKYDEISQDETSHEATSYPTEEQVHLRLRVAQVMNRLYP